MVVEVESSFCENSSETRSESDMTANQFGDNGMVSKVRDDTPDKNGEAPITNGSSAKVNVCQNDAASDLDKTDEFAQLES